MSDEVICFFLALGLFAMMAALIPFLDLIQRVWIGTRNATKLHNSFNAHRHDAQRDA
jgi:hypothetical protein